MFTAIVVFAVARPVAASSRYWATGSDVQINLLDHCGEDFTYPANTPFFISHGWLDGPWTTEPAANKSGFMASTTYFEFRIDRVPQPSRLFVRNLPDSDLQLKLFISEYDQGLTGTHRFGSLWFLDGALAGGTPGEAVFTGGCVSYVSFV